MITMTMTTVSTKTTNDVTDDEDEDDDEDDEQVEVDVDVDSKVDSDAIDGITGFMDEELFAPEKSFLMSAISFCASAISASRIASLNWL